MMGIRIIIDSASDYVKEHAEAMGLKYIPLQVAFGDVSYRDGIDITKDEFYEKLASSTVTPMTSQPATQDIAEVYRSVVDAGDVGIVITLASSISGTYHHCAMMAKEYEGQIFVINSGTASLGVQLIAEEALSQVAAGASVEEVIGSIEANVKRAYTFATLDTLEYLKRGGRISPTMKLVAGLLSVKPIIVLHEDQFELAAKGRGRKNAFKVFHDLPSMTGHVEPHLMRLGYSGTSREPVESFLAQYPEMASVAEPLGQLGSVIGTHVGPGSLVMAFLADAEQ